MPNLLRIAPLAVLLLAACPPPGPGPGPGPDTEDLRPRPDLGPGLDLSIQQDLAPPAPDLSGLRPCTAQDAKGVGLCDRFFGVAWTGKACVGVSGCSCEGKDCGSLFRSITDCEAAYGHCLSGRADGAPCSDGSQCRSGICEGMGCGPDEARCAPKERACTKDLVPYCGCDGMTFRSSSTCPGRPYRYRGACM